jgi:hypothetical protein
VPRDPADPIRGLAGGIVYASNQIRVRLPADPEASRRLIRVLVERLAAAADAGLLSGADGSGVPAT